MSLKIIAEKAQVSESTVSLVMNNRPGVNARTREKVLAIAQEIGYVPNSIARSLALKKSNIIGLVITDVENPFYGTFTKYINDIAKDNSYSLFVSISYHDENIESEVLNTLISQRVDGIIVTPSHKVRSNVEIFDQIDQKKIPCVLATSNYGRDNDKFVMTDYTEGSYRLTNYLLSIGHRKIVFIITSDTESPINSLRVDGYRKSFKEAGLEVDEKLIVTCNGASMNYAYLVAKELMQKDLPDAIITINDIMAIGVEKAAKELKIKIPEDLSVAGYDDILLSTFTEPPLTTVRQNIEEIAVQSMEMLFNLIDNKPVAQEQIYIPPELILRASTTVKK